MRKVFLIIMVFSAINLSYSSDWADADESCFKQGDMNASAGVSLYHFGIYGTFDYAFHDALSAGGGLGYNGYSHTTSWRYNFFPILARVLFHPFNLSVLAEKISVRDKVDVYAGFAMGWNIGWSTWKGAGNRDIDPDIGGFSFRENIGVRYYFAPEFYVFGEEGAGFGLFNGGAGIKF